jgi:hypothetical protein
MHKHSIPAIVLITAGFSSISFCIGDNSGKPELNETSIPEIPRIHSIKMSDFQPQESDPSVIWYDDFSIAKEYLESSGAIDNNESFDAKNGSMKAGFKKGEVNGEGNRKLAFGDFPDGSVVVNRGKTYDEIYWRIYVKHEYDWEGAPAKMSRATGIVSEKWQQSMIVHVWSGEQNSLTLDPASGVYGQSDSIITTGYNDFNNLRWLGNNPCSSFQISSENESGYWVLVEASVKLNSPGKSDGSCNLWIDGRLEAKRVNLNFRGSYTRHGVNAVFLESYWNNGALKTEGRWYDNFVVSTKPVGPVTCPANPVLIKTPYHGSGELATWQIELATDFSGSDVVYRSNDLGTNEEATIDTETGNFTGTLQGKTDLNPETIYYCRVRQKSTNGQWSDWSRWHQPFITEKDQSAIR